MRKRQSFKNKIEEVLQSKGFPEAKLSPEACRLIGTNPHEMGQFIRNEKQPRLDQAVRMAEVLGCELADLYHYQSQKIAA